MSEANECHLISPVIANESRISPDADEECVLTVRCRTVAALARRVLRVSASARRVAAAYGNACEQIFGPSHLISHRSKSNPGLSSRLTWHDFAYVTMVPSPQHPSHIVPHIPKIDLFKWILALSYIPTSDKASPPRVSVRALSELS